MSEQVKETARNEKEERIRRERREDMARWVLSASATLIMVIYILLLLVDQCPGYPDAQFWP